MSTVNERNREGLESVLKRVAREYATGKLTKEQFDKFAGLMEEAFLQLDEMERAEDSEAKVHPAPSGGC